MSFIENNGFIPTFAAPAGGSFLLLETGDHVLQETNDGILLE